MQNSIAISFLKDDPIFCEENITFSPELRTGNSLKTVYDDGEQIGYFFKAAWYGRSKKNIGNPDSGTKAYFWLKSLIDLGELKGEIEAYPVENSPKENHTWIQWEVYAIVEKLDITSDIDISELSKLSTKLNWSNIPRNKTAEFLPKIESPWQHIFQEFNRWIPTGSVFIDCQEVNMGYRQGTNTIIPFDIVV